MVVAGTMFEVVVEIDDGADIVDVSIKRQSIAGSKILKAEAFFEVRGDELPGLAALLAAVASKTEAVLS